VNGWKSAHQSLNFMNRHSKIKFGGIYAGRGLGKKLARRVTN
jgi:hypothetical protein